MAAPAFRNISTAGSAVGANVTCNVPSTTADGDILIFWLSKDAVGTVTDVSGAWNTIQEETSNSFHLYVAWKRASSEPASYTWNFASTWRDCVMISYSGAASVGQAANPLDPDTPPSIIPYTGTASLASPSITTGTADTRVVVYDTSISLTVWNSPPGGWSERTPAGDSHEVHVMDQADATAGTNSGATMTYAGTIGASKAGIFAIQSLPDDQHYFPPPDFPGVFNLDARRMI